MDISQLSDADRAKVQTAQRLMVDILRMGEQAGLMAGDMANLTGLLFHQFGSAAGLSRAALVDRMRNAPPSAQELERGDPDALDTRGAFDDPDKRAQHTIMHRVGHAITDAMDEGVSFDAVRAMLLSTLDKIGEVRNGTLN